MKNMRALKPEELEMVSGGASNEPVDRHPEFVNAWRALGLSEIYGEDSKMEEKYKEWESSLFGDSAFDFLLSMAT